VVGARDVFLQHDVATRSGAFPASCLMGITDYFAIGKVAEHIVPPSSAEVKNGGAIPPLPHMSSWHVG
jgi:hypothetical protein